jgi:cell division protein FtsB
MRSVRACSRLESQATLAQLHARRAELDQEIKLLESALQTTSRRS